MKSFKLITSLSILLVNIAMGQENMASEREAVITVMKSYKDALQNLTTDDTFELFTEDSKVFDSGGVEGSYAHYIKNHLGPELRHFEKFEFSDYEIDAEVDLPYAFTTETYMYTIVLKLDAKGNSPKIKKQGVATSILKKIEGKWQIIKTHSSSRNAK